MIGRYAWPGGAEHFLATGIGYSLKVLILPPFFEEANRTRRLLAETMRRLAESGIGSLLPDLPGTGESLAALAGVRLEDWRAAAAAAAGTLDGTFVTLALRGGALIDDVPGACGHIRLSPITGAAMLRDLFRTRLAADREDGATIDMAGLERLAADGPVELAGSRFGPALLAGLRDAVPAAVAPLRTLRLESDPAPADARLAAPPPWRRAEPGEDAALTDALAAEVARWAGTCAG